METKYTPGPWHVNSYMIQAGSYGVASVYGTTGGDALTSQANARLIAAAPDLLEAAKAAVAHERLAQADLEAQGITLRALPWQSALEAAIAKAEGR